MTSHSFKLSKGDSDDIGFASTCLVAGVINFDEFKQWLYFVIENSDDIPGYVFDVLDLHDKFDFTLRMNELMGFHASWQGQCSSEENALDGIAYKRNNDFVSDAVSREEALLDLEKHPQIENKFQTLFPFIKY